MQIVFVKVKIAKILEKEIIIVPNSALEAERKILTVSNPLHYINKNVSANKIFFINTLKVLLKEYSDTQNPVFLDFNGGMDKVLSKIWHAVVNKPSHPLTMGISGESGGGKTSFVRAISRQDVTVLNGDHFYMDRSGGLNDHHRADYLMINVEGFSFDDPQEIDFACMKNCFRQLAQGKETKIPEYDFCTCAVTPAKTLYSPTELALVLESIFALNESMENEYDITIYVDAKPEIIKQRWYERAASRGITGKSADIRFADVQKKAEIHIRSAKLKADIVINGQACLEDSMACFNNIFEAVKDYKKASLGIS